MNHWFYKHKQHMTLGDRIADKVAAFIGSWKFIIAQSLVMACWVLLNLDYTLQWIHFDPYPFIFLNLFMSAEAAFSTPLIMMAQNRAAERDRHQADEDYQVNREAKREIEALQLAIATLETEKLDKLISKLDRLNNTVKKVIHK